MEDAGAGAIVLYSLFEEQINAESHALDEYLTAGANRSAEAISYFPEATAYRMSPDGYLEHIRRAKAAVNIPIIASLNGVSSGGPVIGSQPQRQWIKYARLM